MGRGLLATTTCQLVALLPGEGSVPGVMERPDVVLLAALAGEFAIGGNATHLFYPGTSQAIDLVITNPFKFAIKVISISVTVGADPTKDGRVATGCPASGTWSSPARSAGAWSSRAALPRRSRPWVSPRPAGRS